MCRAYFISPAHLEGAYEWLCACRQDWPDHADVWDLRANWHCERLRIQEQLDRGTYRFNLERHPDKTFIGYVARGFDFLGYRFGSNGLVSLARQTILNFEAKLSRLYEHWHRAPRQRRIGLERAITTYSNRFAGWAYGGLGDVVSDLAARNDLLGRCAVPRS